MANNLKVSYKDIGIRLNNKTSGYYFINGGVNFYYMFQILQSAVNARNILTTLLSEITSFDSIL